MSTPVFEVAGGFPNKHQVEFLGFIEGIPSMRVREVSTQKVLCIHIDQVVDLSVRTTLREAFDEFRKG